MSLVLRILTIVLSAGVLGRTCAAAPGPTGWVLVWHDEFDQADGSRPDPGRWAYDTGAGGWGNQELQFYTSRTNNARIEHGHLVVEARKEAYSGSAYTSARLKTQGKQAWTYGRVEARIQVPRGQGIWPAFWMLGANINSAGWPACGELDIMENIGREPTRLYGTMHGPGYAGGAGVGQSIELPGRPDLADEFHVYAVEWTPSQVRWLVDGWQYFSAAPESLPAGANWVFTQPQFLLLNVAVGGAWPGSPDEATKFPQRMMVDFVRVYAPEDLPSTGTNVLEEPGFESGNLSGWVAYGSGKNTLVEGIRGFPVRSGGKVFKVFGRFNGSENYSGLYQDRPASAGQVFAAHGWALTPAQDAMAGGNTAWLEVTFRSAQATVLAAYQSGRLAASTPVDLWARLAVTNRVRPGSSTVIGVVTNLVAPAGTSHLRFQVLFRQPALAAGAAFLDDLSLEVAPVTAFPAPMAVVRTGSGVVLELPTYLDWSYALRRTSTLPASTWEPWGPLIGTGGTVRIEAVTEMDSQFWQAFRLAR